MFCGIKNDIEPFVIRAVQQSSLEKDCREKEEKVLKEKALKTIENMKLVSNFQEQCFPKELLHQICKELLYQI